MATQKNEILHEPPLDYLLHEVHPQAADAANDEDKSRFELSAPWRNWLTNVKASFSEFFRTKTLHGGSGVEHVAVLHVNQLTTTERDALQDMSNGAIIYNTTTNKLNFYENGAWVEYTT